MQRFSRLILGLGLALALATAPALTSAASAAPSGSTTTTARSAAPHAIVVRANSFDRGKTANGPLMKSVFLCDTWTHICVKFNKSETRAISQYGPPGIIGASTFAAYLCGVIGNVITGGVCTAVIAVYSYLLQKSFDTASAQGRCVELHFGFNVLDPINAFWWKTEDC